MIPLLNLQHKPQQSLGKTGKFFFGKTALKSSTPQKEREPIKCVILDVGGERFIAQRNSLLKYPTTRLGKLMRSSTIQGFPQTHCQCKIFYCNQAFCRCVTSLFPETLLSISLTRIQKTFLQFWKCTEGNGVTVDPRL